MKEDLKKIKDAYHEKARTTTTLSGIPVKEIYRPEDIKDVDYERDIGDSGQYPFTRGIYPNMFRGRYWTRREVCGFGTPAHTNETVSYTHLTLPTN